MIGVLRARQADLARQVSFLGTDIGNLEMALRQAAPAASAAAAPVPAPEAPAAPAPHEVGSPTVPMPRPDAPGFGARPPISPAQPLSPAPMPAPAPAPMRTPKPRPSTEAVVSRVIAFAGAGILLIGVSLLLVLAAQSGYFGPVARTSAGGVLAVALVATGLWLRRKQPSNVGAIALAASGVAAGYLDVAAITGLYQWWPRTVGLEVGALIALGGLVLARLWNSQALAVITTLGVMLLVPGLNPYPTIGLAFLLIFTTITTAFHWGRAWVIVLVARIVPTALVSLSAAASLELDSPEFPLLVTGVVVLVLLAFGGPIMALSVAPRERTVSHLDQVHAFLLPLLVGPAIMLATRLERWPGAIAQGVLGVLLIAAAFVVYVPKPTRAASGAMGTLAVVLAVLQATQGEWFESVLLAVAAGSLLMAWWLRDRQSFWRGAVVGAIGLIAYLFVNTAPFWNGFGPHDSPLAAIVSSLLLIAALGALIGCLRVDGGRVDAWVGWASVAFATVAVSTLLVALGSLAAHDMGFRGAHALVTVLLFAFAGWLLLRGLRPDAGAMQKAGYVGAAVAGLKLFVYDLSALDGFARIFAFIVGGLVLLVLGVLYARALEKAKSS